MQTLNSAHLTRALLVFTLSPFASGELAIPVWFYVSLSSAESAGGEGALQGGWEQSVTASSTATAHARTHAHACTHTVSLPSTASFPKCSASCQWRKQSTSRTREEAVVCLRSLQGRSFITNKQTLRPSPLGSSPDCCHERCDVRRTFWSLFWFPVGGEKIKAAHHLHISVYPSSMVLVCLPVRVSAPPAHPSKGVTTRGQACQGRGHSCETSYGLTRFAFFLRDFQGCCEG